MPLATLPGAPNAQNEHVNWYLLALLNFSRLVSRLPDSRCPLDWS